MQTGSYESRTKNGLPLDGICQSPKWRLQMMANLIFQKYLSQKDNPQLLGAGDFCTGRPSRGMCGRALCQSSFRSPSLIQPSFRQPMPMSQVRAAGRMMQIRAMASQSKPVMASFTPRATSLTQPA